MEQINYYTNLQQFIISQFRNNADILQVLKAIANQFEDLQSAINYLLNCLDVDKAEGVFLDFIGWLVGTSRNYFDTTAYFKINSPDINVSKFFWFENPKSDLNLPKGSLTDNFFRLRIKAKIAANTSHATRNENIKIIKNMTFADRVIITSVSPMMLNIELIGNNIFSGSTLKDDIESVLGQGVGIGTLTITGD